jgi:hypothetical protein
MAIRQAEEKVFISDSEEIPPEMTYTAADTWKDYVRPWCANTIGVSFFILSIYQVRTSVIK